MYQMSEESSFSIFSSVFIRNVHSQNIHSPGKMKKSVPIRFCIWVALLFLVPKKTYCFSPDNSTNSSTPFPLESGPQQNSSTSNIQWAKSTAQAYKGQANWIIQGFSDFGDLKSPSFAHEYGSLNWSLILYRFEETFFIDTNNFRFEAPIYARISLAFQTCMGKTISKQQMKWICSTWCNRDPIYLNDFKLIEDAASQSNDTIIISAEFTVFDDERHNHHRINVDLEPSHEMCEMGTDLFYVQEVNQTSS